MIVGDVFSNLGNQLFIYAATKCVALDLGYEYRYRVVVPSFAEVEVGLDNFGHEYSSRFESAFNIDTRERVEVVPPEVSQEWEWTMSAESNFDPLVYSVGDNTRLHGYFQSPRYFEHHRDEVLSWFKMQPALTERAARRREAILESAGASALCGVHVRRGPDYRQWSLMLEPSYYARSLALVAEELPPAQTALVLFSDVPGDALRIKSLRMAQPSGGSLYEDLSLMTLCDALVVSNSTLSWWGGWLGNPRRTVVRPSVWPLSDGASQADDIFPRDWLVAKAERDPWRPNAAARAMRCAAALTRRGKRSARCMLGQGRRALGGGRP